MSEKGIIRRIKPQDVDGAMEVIGEHLFDYYTNERRPVIEDAADQSIQNSEGFVTEVNETIAGCMIYTLHKKREKLSNQFSRPIPCSTTGSFAIIRYAYLRSEYIGQGFGKRMLQYVLDAIKNETDSKEVYVEAWHRPDTPDMRPLLQKYDFEMVFGGEDYWTHKEYTGRNVSCSECNIPTFACACGGGIYRLVI